MEAVEIAGFVGGAVLGVIWLILEWQTGMRLRNIETQLRELNRAMRRDDAASDGGTDVVPRDQPDTGA